MSRIRLMASALIEQGVIIYVPKRENIIMAVKSKREDQKLILEIDNGDLTKLDEVIEKWSFKDYQSFLRFAVSIMLVSEDKYLSIKVNNEVTLIKPSTDFIKN